MDQRPSYYWLEGEGMDSQPWSFLFKEESMACHITSQFNNKLGRFSNKIKKGCLTKPTLLVVELGSYVSSLFAKELHGQEGASS